MPEAKAQDKNAEYGRKVKSAKEPHSRPWVRVVDSSHGFWPYSGRVLAMDYGSVLFSLATSQVIDETEP